MLPSRSPVRNCIGIREAGPGKGDLRFTAGRGASPLTEYSAVANATTENTMEAPLKELDRLNKLVSDEPSMGKSKTPAIQDSLNSLLQTLHVQKKRLEAGLATEAELTMLAGTVEARKKEIDERQKEIYNSLARYGKTLDKVGLGLNLWGQRLTGLLA
jgi:hypothetical protein